MVKKSIKYFCLFFLFIPSQGEGSILNFFSGNVLEIVKGQIDFQSSSKNAGLLLKENAKNSICLPPSALSVGVNTSNSLVLSWISGGASNWQIEYGPIGFSTGTGTLVFANNNSFAINGLNTNVTYDFYVRDSCGINDVSSWFGPISGTTTNCGIENVPYSENFDSPIWLGNFPGNIDSCWERNNTSGYFWTIGQGATPAIYSGPFSDHTTGLGKFIYSEGGTNYHTSISSPWIDVSSLTSPELRFWYHMFGVNIEKMSVLIHDGNAWNNELTLIGPQHNSTSSSLWQEQIIDLSTYIGDTIKIRFRAFKFVIGDEANIAIDDIWIGNSPSCLRPSNFSAIAASDSSVMLSWIGGGAANWQIKYRVAGPSGPFSILQTNSNNQLVTGLDSLLDYEFYVQDSCGIGAVSFWEGPLRTSSRCLIIVAPWAEDFEGPHWLPGVGLANLGNVINECWFRDIGILQQWGTGSGLTSSNSTGPPGAYSGSNYLYREASGNGSGLADINSPRIYIPQTMVNPIFYFQKSLNGDFIDSLVISVDNGSGSTVVFTELGPGTASTTTSWEADSLDLSAFIGDTISLIFTGVNSGIRGDIAIDDIGIREQWEPCLPPQNLLLSNVTPNSIDIAWNSISPGSTQIEYFEAGLGPLGTLLKNATSPYTLANLKPNTNYIIRILDSCITGLKSFVQYRSITTSPCPKPSANFNFNSQSLTTSFTSTSTIADSLAWDFGGFGFSSSTSPIFTFPAGGTFNVVLRVFSYCGNIDSIIIPVTVCDTLEAIWDYLILSKSGTGMSIQFDGSLTKNANSIIWDFGDGFTNTSSLTPIHNYSSQNLSYKVALVIANNCGEKDTLAKRLNQIGLEDWEGDIGIRIYPNPAKDILNVKWNGSKSKVKGYEIYNSGGNLLMKMDLDNRDLESTLLQFDTRVLPVGFYLIRLQGEGIDVKQQFIICP